MVLTNEQWEVLEPLIPNLFAEPTVMVDLGEIRGMSSTASCEVLRTGAP